MSSEKSRNDLLAARDRRQETLDRHLAAGWPSLLFLSLNIPGADKCRPGSGELFCWALERLADAFPEQTLLERACDPLGPLAILGVRRTAVEAKLGCVTLETSHPAARLLDLDVYDNHGRQIGRAALALPPRPCLVCRMTAVECMRTGRHGYRELGDTTDELLAPFRN